MNYNRRSTRPDGLFYREQRKIRGSARGRGGQSIKPIVVFIIALLLAVLAYYLFRR
jgi:hypothetical protein